VVHSDVRKVEPGRLVTGGRHLRVVGNLPYYISTSVLTYLIEQRRWFEDLVLMFQEESLPGSLLSHPLLTTAIFRSLRSITATSGRVQDQPEFLLSPA